MTLFYLIHFGNASRLCEIHSDATTLVANRILCLGSRQTNFWQIYRCVAMSEVSQGCFTTMLDAQACNVLWQPLIHL